MDTKRDSKQQRIPFYDIAKALLIIFVAWGHSDNNISSLGFNISDYPAIESACNSSVFTAVRSFYMPAFFFITGCCSSFDKCFKSFALSRLLTMILPMALFCYCPFWIIYFFKSSPKLLPSVLEFCSGGKWFIAALLVSELLYFVIHQYVTRNAIKQLVICSIFFCLGVILHCSGIIEDRKDFWGINHALLLTFMIPLGKIMKDKLGLASLLVSSAVFLITFLGSFWGFESVPFVTRHIELTYASALPLLVMAAAGSVMIVNLSRLIGHCTLLEFIGKHTLVIFFLHGFFYFYPLLLPHLLGLHSWVVFVGWIGSLIMAVSIPAIISWICDSKYLKVLKGKF